MGKITEEVPLREIKRGIILMLMAIGFISLNEFTELPKIWTHVLFFIVYWMLIYFWTKKSEIKKMKKEIK